MSDKYPENFGANHGEDPEKTGGELKNSPENIEEKIKESFKNYLEFSVELTGKFDMRDKNDKERLQALVKKEFQKNNPEISEEIADSFANEFLNKIGRLWDSLENGAKVKIEFKPMTDKTRGDSTWSEHPFVATYNAPSGETKTYKNEFTTYEVAYDLYKKGEVERKEKRERAKEQAANLRGKMVEGMATSAVSGAGPEIDEGEAAREVIRSGEFVFGDEGLENEQNEGKYYEKANIDKIRAKHFENTNKHEGLLGDEKPSSDQIKEVNKDDLKLKRDFKRYIDLAKKARALDEFGYFDKGRSSLADWWESADDAVESLVFMNVYDYEKWNRKVKAHTREKMYGKGGALHFLDTLDHVLKDQDIQQIAQALKKIT